MSSLVFVDLLAFAGAALGVATLYVIGAMLLRPRTAVPCVSVFIGSERAQACMRDGSFNASRARACGGLFLLFASFIAVCVIRAFQHL